MNDYERVAAPPKPSDAGTSAKPPNWSSLFAKAEAAYRRGNPSSARPLVLSSGMRYERIPIYEDSAAPVGFVMADQAYPPLGRGYDQPSSYAVYEVQADYERHRIEHEHRLQEQNDHYRKLLREQDEKLKQIAVIESYATSNSYAALRAQYDAGRITLEEFDRRLTPEASEAATLASPFTEPKMGFLEPRRPAAGRIDLDADWPMWEHATSMVAFLLGLGIILFDVFAAGSPMLFTLGVVLMGMPAVFRGLDDDDRCTTND